jgi:hypothetical protein
MEGGGALTDGGQQRLEDGASSLQREPSLIGQEQIKSLILQPAAVCFAHSASENVHSATAA